MRDFDASGANTSERSLLPNPTPEAKDAGFLSLSRPLNFISLTCSFAPHFVVNRLRRCLGIHLLTASSTDIAFAPPLLVNRFHRCMGIRLLGKAMSRGRGRGWGFSRGSSVRDSLSRFHFITSSECPHSSKTPNLNYDPSSTLKGSRKSSREFEVVPELAEAKPNTPGPSTTKRTTLKGWQKTATKSPHLHLPTLTTQPKKQRQK